MADETYPINAQGMLGIANELAERLIASQSAIDLFAAVLATVHAVEWDPDWKRETADFKSNNHEAFRIRHPEWDLLRRIGNGMKHAERRHVPHVDDLSHRGLEWEDLDFWENTGWDVEVWFVSDVTGKERAVASVCLDAIRSLQAELSERNQNLGGASGLKR